jgi:O-antigen/teichoic acid export membrane protein
MFNTSLIRSKHLQQVLARFPFLKHQLLRRLALNAGKLLSANAFATVMGLLAATFTARYLGPETYGILALIIAYEVVISGIVSFQAWQAIIKFGSDAIAKADDQGLKQIIKLGFTLDIASGIVGYLIAVSAGGTVIRILGWDPDISSLLSLYCIMLLFRLEGTPNGILRLFDRFDLLSLSQIISAIVRILGIAYCIMSQQAFHIFVWVYMISIIIGQLYLVSAALWTLYKQALLNFWKIPLDRQHSINASFWEYIWTSNINSTIRMTAKEFDIFVIGFFLDATAVGIFKIAKLITRPLLLLADPLYSAIYPELVKLWSQRQYYLFLSVVKLVSLVTGIVGIIVCALFMIMGKWLIMMLMGPQYLSAYPIAVLFLVASIIAISTLAFTPANLAMGKPKNSLVALTIATVLYFSVLPLFVWQWNAVGAAIAQMGYYLVWAAILLNRMIATYQTTMTAAHAKEI